MILLKRLTFVLALLLVACTVQSAAFPLASESLLPNFVRAAPPRVREAYRFAIANAQELTHYPCYCGCSALGHTSNLSCYIDEVASDGSISFDTHALNCGICVDITQDVLQMRNNGSTALETRNYIDAQYSSAGPSTNTAMPSE